MKKERKNIRLKEYDYSLPGMYFVTICIKNRKNLFGNIFSGEIKLSRAGKIARDFWLKIPEHFLSVQLDEFVIMPNHLHGILTIFGVGAIHELPLQMKQRRRMLLPKIVGWFKMNSAKQINVILNNAAKHFWQRNYWEHIIRNEKGLNKIRQYAVDNPPRWEFDKENLSAKPDKFENDFWRYLSK